MSWGIILLWIISVAAAYTIGKLSIVGKILPYIDELQQINKEEQDGRN
jgi:hypothetical protein